jgi:hypothetical protein
LVETANTVPLHPWKAATIFSAGITYEMHKENTISEAAVQKVGLCSHVQKLLVKQEYVYTVTNTPLLKYK